MTARILRPFGDRRCWSCGAPEAQRSGVFARAPDGTPLHAVLLCRVCHEDARDGSAVRLVATGEGSYRVARRDTVMG